MACCSKGFIRFTHELFEVSFASVHWVLSTFYYFVRFAHLALRSLSRCSLLIVRFAHSLLTVSFALLTSLSSLFLALPFSSPRREKGLPPYRSVNQSWATCSGSKALPHCARMVLFIFKLAHPRADGLVLKIKSTCSDEQVLLIRVPTTGFEPARLLAPPPQDGMSTNFTTWASFCCWNQRAQRYIFYQNSFDNCLFLQKSKIPYVELQCCV